MKTPTNRAGLARAGLNGAGWIVAAAGLLIGPLSVLAQTGISQPTGTGGGGSTVVIHPDDPSDPRVQAYAKTQKRRVDMEKELYKLRAEYFRNMRNVQIRQVGLNKLAKYTDPVIYPSLIKIFENEGMDVQGAILDLLADQKSDEGDTTVAWQGVFGKTKEVRAAAADRLKRRLKESGKVASDRIRSVVAQGLRTDNLDEEINAAAKLAAGLGLVEAIPMLINAQVGGGNTTAGIGNGDSSEHSLAQILIGTQTAFVSNLTPVVGDSAVGFDPQVSVITEGTYIRVIDAAVITYRVDVHNALIGLSSAAWGRPTDRLGWDNSEWQKWYTGEFLPFWAAKEHQAGEAAVVGVGVTGKK